MNKLLREKTNHLTRRSLLKGSLSMGLLSIFPLNYQALANDENTNSTLFAIARKRWQNQLRAGDVKIDKNNKIDKNIVADQLTRIRNTAKNAMETYTNFPKRIGLWEDLPLDIRVSYNDSQRITETFRRLYDIALAWALDCLGTERKAAFNIITDGLCWLNADVFSLRSNRYGNWYVWDISAPQTLNDILVLTYDALNPELRSSLLDTQVKLTPSIPQHGTFAAAGNRVFFCDSICGRGILSNSLRDVYDAKKGLDAILVYAKPYGGPVGLINGDADEKAYFSHDGFYPDGSFIQHGKFPYIGGYGASLLSSITNIAARVTGTDFSSDISIVVDWIHQSYEPWLWNGLVMDTVRGRGLAKVNGDKDAGLLFISGMIDLLPSLSGKEKSTLSSLVKAELMSRENARSELSLVRAIHAEKLLTDKKIRPRPPLVGTWIFGAMDRALHRRKNWSVAFAMNSLRMANYETGTDTNLRGWYTADGASYLYNHDQKQFGNAYWCTVDSYRLPGTTIDTVKRESKAVTWRAEYNNPNLWAGGVTSGRWGAAGMILTAEPPSSLRAHISRFFFDDCYVCLGAGIEVNPGRFAETIVENRRVTKKSTARITVDEKPVRLVEQSQQLTNAGWIHLEGVAGYLALQKMNMRIGHETRSGKLSDISRSHMGALASQVFSNEFVSIVIEHGQSAIEASYAYVVYPNASISNMIQHAKMQEIKVISNNNLVQAVQDESSGRFAANFFAASSSHIITVNAPCAVTIEENKQSITLCISNPIQNEALLTISLAIKTNKLLFASPGISIKQNKNDTKILVDTSQLAGSSLTLTLKKALDG